MAKTQKEHRILQPVSLPKLSGLVAIGIIAILVGIFYSGHLFGGSFLWEDFVEQEFPFRTLAASSLASGTIPHWNPYVFCGMPFLADIQVAFWYPMNMVQSLFVSDGHLSPVVMQWFIILHYIVAGVGMFFLVKKVFKTDDWSALFAAIAYAFSGYLTMQIIHQMIVYQLALFPFIVLCIIQGFDSLKYAIAGGLLLGVMYLAGHPQTTLFLTLFLGALVLYEIGYRLRGKGEEKLSATTVLAMVIPFVIAVGIFAIQLLPSQELAGLSKRDVMTFENSVGGGRLSFGSLFTLIMPRLFGLTDAMRQAKVPFWNGEYFLSWETAVYIGVLPLLFGVLASLVARKKKYVALFCGMSLFAFLFSLGDNFFLYKIFFSLPIFDRLRTPARMMMVATFALSALSGVGLSMFLRNEIEEKKRSFSLIVGGLIGAAWVAGIAGIISASSFLNGAPAEANASISWAAGLAAFPVIAALVITFLVWKNMIKGVALASIVIGVTLIELFMYGMPVNKSSDDPRSAFRDQPDQTQVVEMLKKEQAQELSRANIRLGGASLLKRNQGAYDRIQLLEGYNPLVLAEFAPQCASSMMTMDLLNIKWRIIGGGFAPTTTYLPRAKMYYTLDVRSPEDAKQVLKTDSTYDYHSKLLLEEEPSLAIGQVDSVSSTKIVRYEMNEIEVKVSTKANGMLFLSEVNYPAWKATVDGKDAKIYKAFTTLRAVEVPAGEHTVIMRYESDAFKTGSMISLATLILSLGGLGFFVFKKKNS
ncbi:MAG TPA: YfhO family protein [Candidatus Kapabacteria bacterium]